MGRFRFAHRHAVDLLVSRISQCASWEGSAPHFSVQWSANDRRASPLAFLGFLDISRLR